MGGERLTEDIESQPDDGYQVSEPPRRYYDNKRKCSKLCLWKLCLFPTLLAIMFYSVSFLSLSEHDTERTAYTAFRECENEWSRIKSIQLENEGVKHPDIEKRERLFDELKKQWHTCKRLS